MTFHAWLCDSLTRQFPSAIDGMPPCRCAAGRSLHLAKGEKGSLQVGFQFDGPSPAAIDIRLHIESPLHARARRVGLVPVPRFNTQTPDDELDGHGHIPGYVPDILWPDTRHTFPSRQTHAYWIDIIAPFDTQPGRYALDIELLTEHTAIKRLKTSIQVAPVTLQPRTGFPVTHWFYADAIFDAYRTSAWTEEFWKLFDAYVHNLVTHGSDTLYVPVFTPPLDGTKRPTQLLGVVRTGTGSSIRYHFDWNLVDQWIDRARRAGIKHFEWPHLFTQWGASHAIKIYGKKNGDNLLLWPDQTLATSTTYRRFLTDYLPSLKQYLDRRNLLNCSFFHLSDEPNPTHLAAYRAARQLLHKLAPWMKIMDALSHLEFAQEGLTDFPIPVVSAAMDFKAAGIDAWCYFCCEPRGRHINRLLDTPLYKVRMAGWLFYRLGIKGFLHWGYNYWYKRQTTELIDPFSISDGLAWPAWAHGDTFVVYPGAQGPIDSIRWEVFSAGLQDYALLQTLGIDPENHRLRPLKSFADFPRNSGWIEQQRQHFLSQMSTHR